MLKNNLDFIKLIFLPSINCFSFNPIILYNEEADKSNIVKALLSDILTLAEIPPFFNVTLLMVYNKSQTVRTGVIKVSFTLVLKELRIHNKINKLIHALYISKQFWICKLFLEVGERGGGTSFFFQKKNCFCYVMCYED